MKLFYTIAMICACFLTKAQVITTIAGNGNGGDGTSAITAQIYDPSLMAFDKYGNLYFSGNLDNTIRKIDTAGIIHTIAGNGSAGFSGDNGPAISSELNQPLDIAFDTAGNLYIADQVNNRIRKITTNTGIITTVVGDGTAGFAGDNGPAITAKLNNPYSICFDAVNNLYIADALNMRIRKVDVTGTITTIAGNGVFASDGDGGPAINASTTPVALRFDAAGNLYVAEANLLRVRKINTAGIISTVAGDSASYIYNGDEIPATQANMYPAFLAINPNGLLYITDQYNNRIRKVDSNGVIHTVAGNGTAANTGDNGPATAASIDKPTGIVFDSCGNLYICQINTPRIRKVTYDSTRHYSSPADTTDTTTSVHNTATQNSISIYPNPAKEQLMITGGSNVKDVMILNAIGQVMMEQHYNSYNAHVNVSGLKEGLYFISVKDEKSDRIVRMKFLKE